MPRTQDRQRRKDRLELKLWLVTLAVFAAAAAGWKVVSADLPGHPARPGNELGRTRWIRPGVIPFTVEGDAEAADVLVIGDSRIWYGIDRAAFAEAGIGTVAGVWYGGADLRVLLSEVRGFGVEKIVVALSPHALSPVPNAIMKEISRQRAPVFDAADATPEDVAQWVRDERAHLVSAGIRPEYVEPMLRTLRRRYLREREDATGSTRSIDRRLGLVLNRVRYRFTYTIWPSNWRRSWVNQPDPSASSRNYQSKLRPKLRPERETAHGEVIELIRDLAAEATVACVRLPISPELRAVEDRAADPEWIAAIAEAAGVPYRDFGTSDGTGDGSHLLVPEAAEFSRELARWLRDELGWDQD